MNDSEDDWQALKPSEPLPSQCCGSGCKPCIYDVYQKELEQWEEAKAKKDKSLLTGKKPQCSNSKLTPETFTAFIVSSVDQLTEDTYQYKFELPGNSNLGLGLGQHIVLRGLVNGLEVQRAYTPISPMNAEGYFEVLIKGKDRFHCNSETQSTRFLRRSQRRTIILPSAKPPGLYVFSGFYHGLCDSLSVNYTPFECYEAGLMSQYVKSWKEGDAVFWRGPFGGFPYKANQYGELFMLASGTGLAPMIPILRYITEKEEDETFVTLVGCFRTFKSIYKKSFLQDQSRFWNIRTFYVLSQEHSLENLPWSFQENTHIGRINENMIKSIMSTCRRQPFVLICGSVTFTEDMERCLKTIGLEKESYFIF